MSNKQEQLMAGNKVVLDPDDPEIRKQAHAYLKRTKNEDLVDMLGVLNPVPQYL